MLLSMWILADWLEKYKPTINIQSGEQILKNARLLSDVPSLDNINVYVGNIKDFIPTANNGVICVNGKDTILLETESVEDVFNEIINAFDFYNSWDQNNQELIQKGCTLKEIVDLNNNVFDYPLLIVDSSHQLLAISSPEIYHGTPVPEVFKEVEANRFLPMDTVININQEIHGKQNIKEPYFFESEMFPFITLHKNIFKLNEHIGWLIMSEATRPFTKGISQLFNTLGDRISLWMLNSIDNNILTPQSDLFIRILNQEKEDLDLLEKKIHNLDWLEDDEKYVIKIIGNSQNENIYNVLVKRIQQTFSGCYVIIYENSVVLILNTKMMTLENLLEDIMPLLKRTLTYCGISYPFFEILKLKDAYEQAGIGLIYGNNNPGNSNFCNDYVIDYIKNVLKRNIYTDIKHKGLDILKKYDKIHNTNYYETLKLYLELERNQIKTAEALFIHRNTMVYRINRIHEILGIDLGDVKTRMHLIMSYLLEE